MFHSWWNNQSTAESGLLPFPNESGKNTKENVMRGGGSVRNMDFEAAYPVLLGIPSTAELKENILKSRSL